MARKVFFSFHYERDIWRVSQVRNSWLTKPDREAAGFWDKAEWEEVKKKQTTDIEKWIDCQMSGTSVTVVLIGAETSTREYVRYEIKQSYMNKKGMFGIYIHNNKDVNGNTDYKGNNPFDTWEVKINGVQTLFSKLYPTYDWINDDGYNNFANWIEAAAINTVR